MSKNGNLSSLEASPRPNSMPEQDAPVGKPTSKEIILVLCIAFVYFTEKIIYYGIVTNLVLFCTNDLGYSSADAAVYSLVFTGTNYVFTIFGGWLSDSWLGNYNAIYLGSLICLIGTTMLPLIAYKWPFVYGAAYGFDLGSKRVFFLITLTIVNIGTAPIKACCGPFACVQVEEYGNRAIQVTYHWVYFISEIAPLFTYSVLSYVEEEVSFFWGFLVVLCFNIVGILVFATGRDMYKMRPPKGNQALFQVVRMLKSATAMYSERHGKCSTICCSCLCSSECCYSGQPVTETTPLLTEVNENQTQLRRMDTTGGSLSRSSDNDIDRIETIQHGFLEDLKIENGGPYSTESVEELKWLLNTLLVLSVAILYNTIRFQYSSTYLLQGERMDLDGIPVAFLALFVPLFVILTVPLVDRFVYPFLESRGVRVTLVKRMAFGLVSGLLSVLYAALVEVIRKYKIRNGGGFDQEISGVIFHASSLSILVQIPEYIFIGIADVFVLITGLEFAFSQSPKSLQAFITGIYLFYNGIGSYVGSLLVIIVNAASAGDEWIPNDINKGHLEYYFLLLAGVIIFNMIYLYVITRNYQYVQQYNRRSSQQGQ
ncbi:solute carrier family 15 member 4-like [Lytechinus pictus]|uniref:solute carrier family 15 member 4-like n=1 Tax=Lytechinus pictus TaxID=7653 RepID=UPI0030B9EF83